MVTHSTILAWRIPWSEEPGELRSMRLQRVRHNWSNLAHTSHRTPCTRTGLPRLRGRADRPGSSVTGALPPLATWCHCGALSCPIPATRQPLALLISGMALGRGLTLRIKSLSDHTHSTTWPVLTSFQTQPHGMSEPVTSSIHQNISSTR